MSEIRRKTQSIKIRNGIYLYKQTKRLGPAGHNWHARIYMPIDGRLIHTKTTGTSDQRIAENIAFAFYGDCLVRQRLLNGSIPQAPTGNKTKCRFDRIADQYLDRLEHEAADDPRSIRNYKDYRGTLLGKGGLATFFGKADINEITPDRIREFLQFQTNVSVLSKLSPATQRRTLAVLGVIFKYAYEQRLLERMPPMPKVRGRDNPRPWFEKSEYEKLHRTAEKLASEAKGKGNLCGHEKWSEMADFIIFMVNTFLRPSEWSNLRHAHVTLVDDDEKFLEIAVVQGKTGDRRSVSLRPAIPAYRRVIKRHGDDPSTFLFKPDYVNRQTAKERMRDQFEELLHISGLAYDFDGKKRTLYSLRHTALMLRITAGNINTLILAQNAGTSVEMLQRFYLKGLAPRQSVANIQHI